MCVIVVKPEGVHMPRHMFLDLWKANPDGGGYSVLWNGELRVRHSLDPKQLWQWWRSDQVNMRNPEMVMHLRIATHGPVTLENCHPFIVAGDEQTVMHHNGIIMSAIPSRDDERSDSRLFAETVLSDLPGDWLDNWRLRALVEDGAGGRLAFHTANPARAQALYILNRHSWVERDGLLLSNDYGLPRILKPFIQPIGGGFTRPSDWLPKATPYTVPTYGLPYNRDDDAIMAEWEAEWMERQREEKLFANEDECEECGLSLSENECECEGASVAFLLDRAANPDIANWEGVSIR